MNEYLNIMPFVEIDGDVSNNDISETLDVFNVNDVPLADDDQCIICLAKLNTKPTYSLPECKHTFHQNCIMHWFRQGSSKCPLCNNNGSIQNNSADGVCWRGAREKYAVLRRYSRRKNAPLKLKQFVAKLRKHEKSLKAIRKNVSEFKKREGIFGELKKEYDRLLTKQRRHQCKIRRMKNLLGRSHQIIPVILVERRYVN